MPKKKKSKTMYSYWVMYIFFTILYNNAEGGLSMENVTNDQINRALGAIFFLFHIISNTLFNLNMHTSCYMYYCML